MKTINDLLEYIKNTNIEINPISEIPSDFITMEYDIKIDSPPARSYTLYGTYSITEDGFIFRSE